MITRKDNLKALDGIDLISLLVCIALFIFSCLFYKERIIFTDTAVYAYSITTSGQFFIAAHRFVSILIQILPLCGITMGLSLKAVLCLYSLNGILLPVISAIVCRFVFKDKATTLAILLFYTIMNMWLFYYPVSEFQMGLCLLFVLHAFLLWYSQAAAKKRWLLYLVNFLLVPTIIFSHTLSFYVFIAWMAWMLFSYPHFRKKVLVLPLLLVLAAHLTREYFFQSLVGTVPYDDFRKEGLSNFKAAISSYFDSPLSHASLHTFINDYFLVLLLFFSLLFFFSIRKQWLSLIYFTATIIAFWLLVTVSFREVPYNHYPEHLYQPLPFFIALVFGQYARKMLHAPWTLSLALTGIFLISFSKIYSNHRFYSQRLKWYENYISLMHSKNVWNGVLPTDYIVFDKKDDYRFSVYESRLLSSLPGPDATVSLIIEDHAGNSNKDMLPPEIKKGFYFTERNHPYMMLDAVATVQVLDSLRNNLD